MVFNMNKNEVFEIPNLRKLSFMLDISEIL